MIRRHENGNRAKARQTGITLIELLVAMMIVAILATIAYPSYTEFVRKSRRSDGQGALLNLATRMEKHLYVNGAYTGATVAELLGSADTPEGYYSITIDSVDNDSYVLNAAPRGPQSGDTLCGTLIFASSGRKNANGTCTGAGNCGEVCW